MTQIEIGNLMVCVAVTIAVLMIIAGWTLTPNHIRKTAIAVVLMFVGYQIFEFIAGSFVVIAK